MALVPSQFYTILKGFTSSRDMTSFLLKDFSSSFFSERNGISSHWVKISLSHQKHLISGCQYQLNLWGSTEWTIPYLNHTSKFEHGSACFLALVRKPNVKKMLGHKGKAMSVNPSCLVWTHHSELKAFLWANSDLQVFHRDILPESCHYFYFGNYPFL